MFIGPAICVRQRPVPLLTETNTLVAAMSSAPTDTRKQHINTLIGALKTSGVWSKLGNLYVLAAHDSQAARINWVAPGTSDLTAVNSPTFTTDRGYAGDGATSYLTSGAVFRSPYALNSAHIGTWSNTDVSENAGTIGVVRATSATTRLFPRTASDTLSARVNTTTANNIAVAASLGHSLVSRTGASDGAIYKNGSSIGTIVAASTAVPTDFVSVCRADLVYATQRVAVAHAGSGLTGTEALALYNALNTYLTAVGGA